MSILFISFAPIILILIYIYKRDKYEKEPMGLLAKALAGGAIITLPIIFIEIFLGDLFHSSNTIANAFYEGFVVAAFTEELFKYLLFVIIIWKNRNFNELFDGIIYAVFISLGFAAVENFFSFNIAKIIKAAFFKKLVSFFNCISAFCLFFTIT